MAAILRDSSVAVVRTRPRAIPLAMITMRISFSFLYGYGAPLDDPSGRRSSAIMILMNSKAYASIQDSKQNALDRGKKTM